MQLFLSYKVTKSFGGNCYSFYHMLKFDAHFEIVREWKVNSTPVLNDGALRSD